VERLGARLCLPGHGRPFADVGGHVRANREEVAQRLDAILATLGDGEPTAYELVPRAFGEGLDRAMMGWALTLVLCYLGHLERTGKAERISPPDGQAPERWRALAPTAART
jgi:hypothetical protein